MIQKERMRWLVKFQGTELYVNFDQFDEPDLGNFIEIKARTWSHKDARRKAEMTSELLSLLNVEEQATITDDYIELV